MSNNQATIEDLIDEMYDLLDKGWKMPLSAGKMFVDGEEVRQILDEIKEEIPSEVRKAKAIVADRAQILDEAQREAETIIRVAEEKAKAMGVSGGDLSPGPEPRHHFAAQGALSAGKPRSRGPLCAYRSHGNGRSEEHTSELQSP